MATSNDIAAAFLDRYGQTYADEIGVDLSRNVPSVLFQWLMACVLLSARIRAQNAVEGAAALKKEWATAKALKDSTWSERVRVLNRNGYARYDESTARMLNDVADLALEKYDGDLRKLYEAADGDRDAALNLLQDFKGIGPAGAAIFLREAQGPWSAFYPFADPAALRAAEKAGLPTTARGLSATVRQGDFPALLAALVRADLAGELDAVRKAA